MNPSPTRARCAVAFLCLVAVACSKTPKPEKGEAEVRTHEQTAATNVLLISLDTTRADYLGPYNPEHADLTPNFSQFAREAVTFDMAIATAGATPISHASILTGLNPAKHGVRVISAPKGYKLEPSIPTLTTVLRDAGRETAAFLSAFTVSEYYGFDHGFKTFDSGIRAPANSIITSKNERDRWDVRAHQRRADATTHLALKWLDQDRGEDPFFLWVHYWDPHDKQLKPPRKFMRRFGDGATDFRDRKKLYKAEVQYVDEQFGRLIANLKASGAYDNTIIVIVADHGQGLGDHGWAGHRILYQEQIHVPLLIRAPGWPEGTNVSELVRITDIYPTVLGALGLTPPKAVDGLGLEGLVRGKDEPERLAYADCLSKYDYNSYLGKQRPYDDLLYAAMDRSWKLIYRPDHPEKSELFNIARDPKELRNLYAEEPAQAKRLKAALDGFGGYVNAPFGDGEIPEDVQESLKSLGYIEDDP